MQLKNLPWRYFLFSFGVVLADQALKLWVHYNMEIGEWGAIKIIGDWLKLYYVLNQGMAFGVKFSFIYGKLFLTMARLVASVVLVWYLIKLSKHPKMPRWISLGWASVLGGAIGNIIDSVFYGVCFGNAPCDAPIKWFHGQVIDMIYLHFINIPFPKWIPVFGGQNIMVCPIFNIADIAITLGVTVVLIAGFVYKKRINLT